jgi:TM2 domain-containing membrane protein YozV
MDALETQLLIEKAKIKSPGFAAILGFFFPALAAFYTRRIGAAIVYLIIDFFNLILVVIGVGVITGFLFRLIAGYFAFTWARDINQRELERVVVNRKSHGSQVA